MRALQSVSGGFHLELEMTKEPGTKGFCSRQSITQKTTRIKAKVCWKEKVLKNGIFLKNSISLSLHQTMETDQTILLLQTDKQLKRNQHKSCPHFQTMQLKQREKIAESQEKVRDDGEDVNEREREMKWSCFISKCEEENQKRIGELHTIFPESQKKKAGKKY